MSTNNPTIPKLGAPINDDYDEDEDLYTAVFRMREELAEEKRNRPLTSAPREFRMFARTLNFDTGTFSMRPALFIENHLGRLEQIKTYKPS